MLQQELTALFQLVGDGKDELIRKAEESYKVCLSEDPSNADTFSNLAKLLSDINTKWSDDNLTANILELYE